MTVDSTLISIKASDNDCQRPWYLFAFLYWSTGQAFAFFMLETRENTMVKAANRRKTKEIGRV